MDIVNDFHSKPHNERRAIIMSGVFFILCIGLGVFFHFAFELFGEPKLLAPFLPVNESVFEHLKLIYVPYILILMPIEYYLYGRFTKKFVTGKLIGVLIAMSFVVMEFYTIQGAFGEPNAFVNITIFCIATFLAYLVPLWLSLRADDDSSHTAKLVSLFALAVMFVFFVAFTFYPPKLPLFLDPRGAGYGYFMFE